MSSNDFERMVDFLFRRSDGLDLLLQATPYDDNRDLEKHLTEEIFFEHFLVEKNERFEDTLGRLKKLTSERNKIVFLEGHSGVGKTTIIRKYTFDSRDDCLNHYINCQHFTNTTVRSKFSERKIELMDEQIQKEEDEDRRNELIEIRTDMRNDLTEKEKENAITNIIREYIQKDAVSDVVKNSFLFFLSNNKSIFSGHLVGKSIKEQLNKLPRMVEEAQDYTEAWDDLFAEMETKDSFILLFTFLEFLRTRRKIGGKAKVIIFDNLDAIPLDLLHKDFLNLFYRSLEVFRNISAALNRRKTEYPFLADYNFIFALRDANNASIGDHIKTSHDGVTERIYYRCGPNFYKDITATRLHFYVNKIEAKRGRYETASYILALLNFITGNNFYTEIFIPAFNMDNRRMTKSLYKVMENFVPARTRDRFSPNDWSDAFSIQFPKLPEKTISPFSLAQMVPQEHLSYKAEIPPGQMAGFYGAVLYGMIADLNSVEFYQTRDGINSQSGYCLASRMLLTLILNRSDFKDSWDFIQQNKKPQKVALRSILKSTKDIYSENEVIKTLVELFLVSEGGPYSEGGTYLVSFREQQIQNKNAFHDLVKMKENTDLWRVYGRDAELVITPAGFIFLRDLIVHYEFYSLLAKNPKPLFMYSSKSDESSTRDFENSILATHKIVKDHSELMRRFYVNKFGDKDYLSSDFAFKHSGRIAKTEGEFHIMRIVAAHVEYIDEYRRWLLKRAGDQSFDVKSSTNDKLISFIERYVWLLTTWQDKDRKVAEYAEAVAENIKKIRAGVENWNLAVSPAK
jgi:hypothetical protein